ncbi:MAG: GH3 family domain-containing protein, partial [Flavobacteriaceae bacterium]
MSIKTILAKILARKAHQKVQKWAHQPIKTQHDVFCNLIDSAKHTQFGQDHGFDKIKSHADYKACVPIRDYEALRPYVEKAVAGNQDVLWPGEPLYFAKTSGTTSGTKYIPITKASMPHHIEAAKNALFFHIHNTGDASFADGKLIFLQGSPVLSDTNGIATGRLSGIVAHYVPSYLQKNRLPSWETNCIEDWETKVDAIVEETHHEDMRLIGGIPPWVSMYYEKLIEKTGKKVGELFPNLKLFVYGGVNFEPYRSKLEALVGRNLASVELYPASEGFFAFQDQPKQKGMLLQLNSGIFYEFVPADKFFEPNPPRLTIGEVALDTNYVMLISTNAGLWAYNVGDTVMFTDLNPYRVVVTGRIKHFISAFGEHVIGKEVEEAMQQAVR